VDPVSKAGKWVKANWILWLVPAAYLIAVAVSRSVALRAALIGVETLGGLIATLVTVFLFIGLFQVWVSQDFVVRHMGEGSGAKGLLVGGALGTLIHGPLVGVFPLLKALLSKGARVGVVVVIVSTYAIKLPMIPLEVGLFGWKFTLVREGLLFASAFVMAPLMEWALGAKWLEGFAHREAVEEKAAAGEPAPAEGSPE